MTRVPAKALPFLAPLLLAGCLGQATYDSRTENYLKDLQFAQRLNQYLAPPAPGRLQELGLTVRPPKELAPRVDPLLRPAAGLFEASESFGGGPLGMHVFVRLKNPPRPQVAEGEEPPPPVDRGGFNATVDAIADAQFPPADEPKRSNAAGEGGQQYTRRTYQTGNGYTVDTYYYQTPDSEVALVFLYQPADQGTAPISRGIPLTLGALRAPGSS